MLISASRRTDIPAFYTPWFINRIRAGYCTVPNPFNRNQVSHVSLRPEDVDVIIFWTRNPFPLIEHLDYLDQQGYRYYFQFTLMDNPRLLDPKTPPLETALKTFRLLSNRVGAERVIWRYDPIVFTQETGAHFHQETYQRLASALQGLTRRSVISLVDIYAKAQKRLREMAEQGSEIIEYHGQPSPRFDELMHSLVKTAHESGMEIFSCAEDFDLTPYGIRRGKCVDDDYIRQVFGIEVSNKKDPNQREACGCAVSKDIGAYDTCLFGCQYCYATRSFERAKINHQEHNPLSPSLIGWYDAQPSIEPAQLTLL